MILFQEKFRYYKGVRITQDQILKMQAEYDKIAENLLNEQYEFGDSKQNVDWKKKMIYTKRFIY